MRLFIMFVVLLGLLGPAHAQSMRFDSRYCQSTSCDESDWIFDDNSSNHTTVWRHVLGTVPRQISILFSQDPARGPVTVVQGGAWAEAGNPISVEMGRRTVRLHIAGGVPLSAVWRPEGGWTRHREGYWKIIVYK